MISARRFAALMAVLAGLGAAAVPLGAQEQGTTKAAPKERVVSKGTARLIGLQAIRENKPEVAVTVAQRMLAADKTDSFAHFLLATAYLTLNRLPEAQASGKTAYQTATSEEQRHHAARITALAAYRLEHHSSAQWWLRKSAEAAPSELSRAQTVAAFRAVKAQNPLSVKLAFSLAPSDNVNGGSSGQYNIIDGLPYIGELSPDAQALKGTVAQAAGQLSYRLSETAESLTQLEFGMSLRHVRLGSAERAGMDGKPGFDAARVSIGLNHVMQQTGSAHRFTLNGTVGRQTYEQGGNYGFVRLGFGHQVTLAPDLAVDSLLSAEARSPRDGVGQGEQTYALRGTVIRAFGDGDTASLAAYVSRLDSPLVGRSATTLGAQLGYAMGEPIGPVSLSGSIGYLATSYAGYAIAGLEVPGGRDDRSAFVEMKLSFGTVSYAGFAPEVTLRHQRSSSNVSRFDSQESSVTLGLKSLF
jgi:hypothetical protein